MERTKTVHSRLLAALLLALAPAACGEDPTGFADADLELEELGPAMLSVLLTDAPSDYIASAMVDIGEVILVPAGDGDHIVLSEDGTEDYVNLLELQGAATTSIANAEIEAGEYSQLRLIVEAAKVELAEGYEFRDGSTEMDLKVPSGAQTGIKLNLSDAEGEGPLLIGGGESVLVLDFDVNRSFVIQGNPETPAGIKGVLFKPTIRVTGRDVAASISGTVSTLIDDLDLSGLTVTAEPADGGATEGYQTMAGTALTADDGSYTIFFLVPGSYDVSVEAPEGLGTDPEVQNVVIGEAENAVGVDFEVIDLTGSIAGTVSTALEGVSAEGVVVSALSDVEGAEAITMETAADGTYLFEGLLAGIYTVSIEVAEDQLSDPSEVVVELDGGEDVVEVDFEIVEDLTGSIAGTVSSSLGGFALAGLTVTATPEAAGAEALTATTGAGGVYVIEGVPAGNYTVTVNVGIGFVTDPTSAAVEVAEDAAVVGVNFVVNLAGT